MSENRQHIAQEHQWDLTTIFDTDQDWQEAFDELSQAIDQAGQLSGRLAQSAVDLLFVTRTYLELSRRLETIYVYASMKNDQVRTRVLHSRDLCPFKSC